MFLYNIRVQKVYTIKEIDNLDVLLGTLGTFSDVDKPKGKRKNKNQNNIKRKIKKFTKLRRNKNYAKIICNTKI